MKMFRRGALAFGILSGIVPKFGDISAEMLILEAKQHRLSAVRAQLDAAEMLSATVELYVEMKLPDKAHLASQKALGIIERIRSRIDDSDFIPDSMLRTRVRIQLNRIETRIREANRPEAA